MLSVHDCIAFSGLTADQLDAVAFHQGLSPVLAAEWAGTVLDRPDGPSVIETTIAAAARHARASGHDRRADRFEAGLCEFLARKAN